MRIEKGSESGSPEIPRSPALNELLARAARRVRLLRARRFGAAGLLIGTGVSVLALLAFRVHLLDEDILAPEWLFLPPVLCLLVGTVWGAARAVPSLPLLRLLEQSLDLKERLSTAHSFAPSAGPVRPADTLAEAFAARQIADAEAFAGGNISLSGVLPLWPPHRREGAAVIAAVGAFLLYFLPTLPAFQSPAQRAEQAVVKKEGERIVTLARALEKQATQKKLEGARQAAQKMRALGEEMKKGRLSQQKALMKTAKLTAEMRQAQQATAGQSSPKSLPAAAKELGKALASAGNGMKTGSENNPANLNAPQNPPDQKGQAGKTGKAGANATDPLKQMQQAMAQNDSPSLAEQLSRLADQTAQGHPDDKAGRDELAGKLDSLSKALEGTSLSRASEPLKQAADALRSGDMNRAAEKLREASRRAAESAKQGDEANAMQQMADALSSSDSKSGEGEMSDAGEGTGQDDAFNKNGTKKGHHVHTKECLQPGGT